VKEAIAYTHLAIQQAKQRGDSQVRLIVGLYLLFFLSDVASHSAHIPWFLRVQVKDCTPRGAWQKSSQPLKTSCKSVSSLLLLPSPHIPNTIAREHLVAELDPNNAGVLIVYINGGPSPGQDGVVGPDEITRRLEKDNGGCIIM
jgi:hypothetical protein